MLAPGSAGMPVTEWAAQARQSTSRYQVSMRERLAIAAAIAMIDFDRRAGADNAGVVPPTSSDRDDEEEVQGSCLPRIR